MWRVEIHPLIFKEDFRRIDRAAQARIMKAIHKKLSIAPIEYGKPLVGDLKGYYWFRVDDYRVIYRVQKERVTVFVIKVGIRRDDEVYRQMAERLS